MNNTFAKFKFISPFTNRFLKSKDVSVNVRTNMNNVLTNINKHV